MAFRQSTAVMQEALERARVVLSRHPAGLITDIDGTISRIAARPEDAIVSPQVRQCLSLLAAQLDMVGVITGREEAVARHMVQVESLDYIGNYALAPEATDVTITNAMTAAKVAAQTLLPEWPGLEYEDKGVGFSMHYRNCDEPRSVRAWLIESMSEMATRHGGRLVEGKMVLEMVPAELPGKDAALRALVNKHCLNGVIFLGDDVSDVAVFRQLRQLREDGFATLCLGIVDPETDTRVIEASDLTLRGVDETELFLSRLCSSLSEGLER